MTDQEEFRHIIIHTFHPEEEIWHYISMLSGYNYVQGILEDRVKGDFFGLDISQLNKAKKEHIGKIANGLTNQKKEMGQPSVDNNSNKQEEENTFGIEIHEPLSNKQDIENNAKEIVHSVKQAIELYKASQTVSLYAKPILLYYSYTKLARVLYLSTYKQDRLEYKTHGLDMEGNDIRCLRAGAFSRFHDSYSSQPSIYLDNYTFNWQDLLEQPTDRFRIFEIMRKADSLVDLKVKNRNSSYAVHELTREIIFTYAMSMLARYRVTVWSEIIEGTYVKKDIFWKIKDYLRQTQSFFPNLVFNKLHALDFYFYPEPASSYMEYEPEFSNDHE